jgi:hypothetical protein
MSITNIQILHDLAETSLASYAYLLTDGLLKNDLQNKVIGASFTQTQAEVFTAHYKLISVHPTLTTTALVPHSSRIKRQEEKK